jgi:hypothetical protein
MTSTVRQSSYTVHIQHNWTDCWTSWPDVTITKFIAYCSIANWSYSGDASCSETWRLESVSQMHQPYVVILLMWRHTWTTWTLTVLSVARLSKTPQQWLYRVAMNTKMSSDNVLCQSTLEHTKSMTTLIFGETWNNTEINVIQAKVFFSGL